MLPRKILKVETKICAVWGILEANLKKSSTLKFTMNISFLTSICVRRSIILIFIGEKVCLLIFFQRKTFFSMIFDFHFRENPRFRDETGKNQNNMKQTWNKRTIKQNADLLVRTGSSRDTRNRKPDPTHWSFGCSHSHTSPIRESCQTQTSFYFLFQPSPELPFVFHGCVDFRHKCSRLLQVRHERMRFTTRWWAAFRVKSFKAAVIICKFAEHCWYAYKMAANPPTIPKRLTCKWRLGYFPSL